MAIIKVLNKKGETIEVFVKESVNQIDSIIRNIEMTRRNFVRLKGPQGDDVMIHTRYIYCIVDNGTENPEIDIY